MNQWEFFKAFMTGKGLGFEEKKSGYLGAVGKAYRHNRGTDQLLIHPAMADYWGWGWVVF